jgi:hypothetical protein
MRKTVIAVLLVILVAFVIAPAAQAASRTVPIPCGTGPQSDIDNVINGDPPGTTTRFVLGADCTFTPSATLVPRGGDEVVCAIGPGFIQRANAWDPQPRCTIEGFTLPTVMKPEGLIYLEGFTCRGGDFTGSAPTGVCIAEGQMHDSSWVWGVEVRDTEAAGISNARGVHHVIELTNTTTNSRALGYIGSGIKGSNEFNIEYSYVHDNQGNGIWCDNECNDAQIPHGAFFANSNLVVNNGREGIRFERVGDEANHGEAWIANNEVHGNGRLENRAGIGARDSQDALITQNTFGPKTINAISYGNNSGGAVRASDSGRTDRPNLLNIDIVSNALNGEGIQGCELPDEIVYCFGNTP